MPSMTFAMADALSIRPAQLIAAILLAAGFAPFLSFSVLIPVLELQLDTLRTEISAIFGVGFLAASAGAIVAQRTFDKVGATLFPLSAAALAAAGTMLAALGLDYASVLIGWGVLFGAGAGVAMTAALRAGRLAVPANNTIGSAWVLGAVASGFAVSAAMFATNLPRMGLAPMLWLASATVSVAGLLSALLFFKSRTILEPVPLMPALPEDRPVARVLVVGMVLAALAASLVLGHAHPVITYFGGTHGHGTVGMALVAAVLAAGMWLGRVLQRRITVRSVAVAAHAVLGGGVLWVLAQPTGTGAVIAMTAGAFGAGLGIGFYVTGLTAIRGKAQSPSQRLTILLTLGIGGLAGPIIGGFFVELTADYRISLEMACVAAFLGLINAMRIPRVKAPPKISSV